MHFRDVGLGVAECGKPAPRAGATPHGVDDKVARQRLFSQPASEQGACHVAGVIHAKAGDVAFRRETHVPERADTPAQDCVEQRSGQ